MLYLLHVFLQNPKLNIAPTNRFIHWVHHLPRNVWGSMSVAIDIYWPCIKNGAVGPCWTVGPASGCTLGRFFPDRTSKPVSLTAIRMWERSMTPIFGHGKLHHSKIGIWYHDLIHIIHIVSYSPCLLFVGCWKMLEGCYLQRVAPWGISNCRIKQSISWVNQSISHLRHCLHTLTVGNVAVDTKLHHRRHHHPSICMPLKHARKDIVAHIFLANPV